MKQREIKFRIWNPAGANMLYDIDNVYGCLMQQIVFGKSAPTRGFTVGYDHKSDGMVWMQFTGLSDKNGKEIYEGDIVKCGYGVGQVIFSSGCFWVQWIDDKEANMEWVHSRKGTYIRQGEDMFEIIGNIYEHQNLLK